MPSSLDKVINLKIINSNLFNNINNNNNNI